METMTQKPVFIERDNSNTSQSNSTTDDENSLKPSSYDSNFSSNSNESDPVKCYNKLKRQGSRSSLITEEGDTRAQTKAGNVLFDIKRAEILKRGALIDSSTWLQHKKHFFILSSAGKPVWTR